MAGLRLSTPPAWAVRVAREPLVLLSDHAHCELKAAASAQALIARHPQKHALVDRLCAIAIEELEHFARVVALLRARGGELAPIERNPYAEALLARTAGGRDALLDRLLVSSLIEARSLERFRLLADHAADRDLAALYRDLVASEAAHRASFLRLARDHAGAERADARLAELEEAEAEIVASLPFAVRMHSGAGS